MRSFANFVVGGAIVVAIVSSLFAKSYESLEQRGIEVEYESTIDEAKVRQFADVVAAPSVLGSIDDLFIVLDTEDEKFRMWFGIKPGYENDKEFVASMTTIATVIASTCFDEKSFELVLCTSDRDPVRTLTPVTGCGETLRDGNDFILYRNISREQAKSYLVELRDRGFFQEDGGVCRVEKPTTSSSANLRPIRRSKR